MPEFTIIEGGGKGGTGEPPSDDFDAQEAREAFECLLLRC
jgi:hypothetical protein